MKCKCSKCNSISYDFRENNFFEFPLEKVNNYCFIKGKRKKYNNKDKNPDVDLYDFFEYYQAMELLNGNNQIYCYKCQSPQDSLYGTQIYSAPNYLIIILNRGKDGIYECKANFPEKLNLANYITFKNGKTVFELYGVISHFGPSSIRGYFVAYCKKKKNEHYKWYSFNDEKVSECQNHEEYRNGMSYILFYQAI